jgi:hypothetical protein
MEHTRVRKPLCGQFETTNPGVPASLTTTLERLPPVAEHALGNRPFERPYLLEDHALFESHGLSDYRGGGPKVLHPNTDAVVNLFVTSLD